MLVREILAEGTQTEVVSEIKTQLSRAMSQDISEIPTQEFLEILHDQGYSWITMDQLIELVSISGYASSVNKETIVPANHLGDDVPQLDPDEEEASVSDMASDAAMDGIEDEL